VVTGGFRDCLENAMRHTLAGIDHLTVTAVGSVSSPELDCRCVLCGASLQLLIPSVFDTRFGIPGKYQVWRCQVCELEQLAPLPSALQLKAVYETYYNFGGGPDTLYTRIRARFYSSPIYRLWTKCDGDVSFHLKRGRGRLLDIGCNEGRGLTIYARNGFQVEGLELNTRAAEVARQAGFVVSTDLLREFRPEKLYDVAVLSNVLEHSLDPRAMLADVSRILRPGGQVWISCPNASSLMRSMFGRYWINWHVPFHIVHFTSASLRTLLSECGFARVEVRQATPSSWVVSSVIARLFAKPGKPNRALRNPLLVASGLLLVRLLLFPLLFAANQTGRGDCLLVNATKVQVG
jgi:SAM-dependent methyltransferase